MLRALRMKDVGPASSLDLELNERLNVLTGDNGLGKSFVLEVAFWALTGEWAGHPVLPQQGKEESATIAGETERGEGGIRGYREFDCHFDRLAQRWDDRFRRDRGVSMSDLAIPTRVSAASHLRDTVPVLYVQPDGMFSLWDPARIHVQEDTRGLPVLDPQVQHFTPHELWYGLTQDGKSVSNGLVRDWVTWQLESESGDALPYSLLCRVLDRLSHPEEPMKPGKPRRLYLHDSLKYPTIELPYETIPVVHASAGMKRILSLAYLLTWMWTEHVQAARMTGREPADRLVVLIEEPETHLHPKWQRHIVRALLDVLGGLGEGSTAVKPQVLLTTHSPLVLASMEPYFDPTQDKLFSFDLRDKKVVLDEVPWVKRGDALAWLTSEIFGLARGSSPEADQAIEAAYDYMASKPDKLPKGLDSREAIDAALKRLLPDQHPLWPEWSFHTRAPALPMIEEQAPLVARAIRRHLEVERDGSR